MTSYVERLARRSREAHSLVCVGLDPPASLPVGEIASRNRAIIEATAPYAACYKPNLAFYEQFGVPGLRALEATLDAVPGGIPVIGDAKRGDMANTAAAYARALFDVWGFDAVTVNPFLGRDALEPFLAREDRGLYVLCRTSNPGAATIQNAPLAEGRTLYERIAAEAPGWGANVGLVAGATAPAELARIRARAPRATLLVPGVGAQGGDPAQVAAAGREPGLVVVSASRSIADAPDPRGGGARPARRPQRPRAVSLEVAVGDVWRMRRRHPCGSWEWRIYRTGADIGLVCLACGRRVLLERRRFEARAESACRHGPRCPLSAAGSHPQPAALLRQRPFRSLSLTRFSSRAAQNALNLGLVLLVLDATGRSFFTSLLVLALVVPATVAGIVAGVAADTFPRRLIVVAGNVARARRLRGLHERRWRRCFPLRGRDPARDLNTQFGLHGGGGHPPRARRARGAGAGERHRPGSGGRRPRSPGSPCSRQSYCASSGARTHSSPSPAALFLVAAVQAVLIGPVAKAPRHQGGGGARTAGDGPWWKTGWLTIRADPVVYGATIELTLLAMALIILGGLIPLYIHDVLDLSFEVGALVLTPAAAGAVLGLRVTGAARAPSAPRPP